MNSSVRGTDAHDERIIRQIADAIHRLPRDSTSAYLEAVRKAPHIVKAESPTRWFLKREQEGGSTSVQSVWAAAARLALYWERRQEIFNERYVGTLQLPGDNVDSRSSALDAETIELLQTGFLTCLPNTIDGSIVFYLNRSKCSGKRWSNFKLLLLKCLFYWCNIAVNTSEGAITDGVVGLCVINPPDIPLGSLMNNRINAKPALDLIHEAFPIRMKSMHLCCLAFGDAVVDLQQIFLPPIERAFNMFSNPRIPLVLHVAGADPRSLGEKLLLHGFTLQGVPAELGGIHREPSLQVAKPAIAATLDPAASLMMASTIAASTRFTPATSAAPINPRTAQIEDAGFTETYEMQHGGLKSLDDAIDLLPYSDKAAYLAAVQRVPNLVRIESNPMRFLRFERYNAWSAARRLALCWTLRVELFGERAFLPMTMTGDGALTMEDTENIRSGYCCLTNINDSSIPVVCFDPEKRQMSSRETRLRGVFYLWTVICQNDFAQTEGYISVNMLGRSAVGGSRLDSTIKEAVAMVLQAFPTSVKHLHLVNCPSGLGERIFYELLMPIFLRLVGRLSDRAVIHVGEKEELIAKLSAYGLSREVLPDTIGGTWSFPSHAIWLTHRERLERERYRYFLSNHRGSSPTIRSESQQTEEILDQVVSNPVDALHKVIESMPVSEKEEYMKAMKDAPDVVKKDSDPTVFLRYANQSPEAAARRLVRYWKTRCAIFRDRAFLPLDQTGDGALDRKDISVLNSAYLISLPKDSNGRSVLYCDGSRLTKSTRESRLRCSFYLYSVVAENTSTQSDGFVLLYVMTEPSFDRTNMECFDDVLSGFPAFIWNIHLLHYPKDAENSQGFTSKIDAGLRSQFDKITRNEVVKHPAGTKASIAQQLLQRGFSLDGLPKQLGGNYGLNNYFQWQELRVRYEWNLPAGVSNKEEASMLDFGKAKPVSAMTEEERLDRKRKLNVIHSRRKRERERIEVEVLQEQCSEERGKNEHLKRENQRLTGLLDQAKALTPSK